MDGVSLPEFSDRARSIVSGLTVDQCLRLISGADFWTTAEIPGLVPSMLLTDGPHGLRKQLGSYDEVGLDDSVPATCFPVAAALASSWDESLLHDVGGALGAECRAEGVAMLLGPGLNLKRHPRGGRNFEYFSEDPLLSGSLGAAMINGIQATGVVACPKHLAANNQETARMVIDTVVDERTLRDFYLRSFEIAIERSSPGAIMAAYNRLNARFCTENPWLIREVLRGEWGFSGVVVSDWAAVNSGAAALSAGLDLEMPGNGGVFSAEIRRALASGDVAEDALREAASRMVAFALRALAVMHTQAAAVDFQRHHELARRAAVSGTVLLTNNGILPLASARGLVVIGAYARYPHFQGSGSSRINPTRVDSVIDALGPDVPFAEGYDAKTGEASEADIAAAVALAQHAETVLLCVGVPRSVDSEASDRLVMRLPQSIEDLIRAVCAANRRVIVSIASGASLELDWSDEPAALLFGYLGGQASGSALAQILLGVEEPGGRLAESFPVRESDLPAAQNFPGSARQVQYREGEWVGYRFHETFGIRPRFAFGHGLGYTTWTAVIDGAQCVDGKWEILVDVSNSGLREGSTVVQLYVEARDAALQRPTRELAGFAKLTAAPGQTERVAIAVEPRLLTNWDLATRRRVDVGGRFLMHVGFASDDIRDVLEIDLPHRSAAPMGVTRVAPVASDPEFERMLGHVIPSPDSVRPFTRTSALNDLDESSLGRTLLSRIRADFESRNAGGEDGHSQAIARATMVALPIRALATLGKSLSLDDVDALIDAMNREVGS